MKTTESHTPESMRYAMPRIREVASRVADRRDIAGGACLLTLEPAGADFRFIPGQYVRLTLDDGSNANMSHDFSIASSPEDGGIFEIAFRPSESAFKKRLMGLPVDASVSVNGPLGFFTLPDAVDRPVVCIAGGIGVTPFRSMILAEAQAAGGSRVLRLIYANRGEDAAPFLDELRGIAAAHQAFSLSELYGPIDAAALASRVADLAAPVFYIAGPPPMVAATYAMLRGLGVSESDMRMDEFTGYGKDY